MAESRVAVVVAGHHLLDHVDRERFLVGDGWVEVSVAPKLALQEEGELSVCVISGVGIPH
jgi:hypothetical protein